MPYDGSSHDGRPAFRLWRRWKCFHNSSPGDGGDHTGNRSRGSDNSRYSHRGGRTGSCRQCRLF